MEVTFGRGEEHSPGRYGSSVPLPSGYNGKVGHSIVASTGRLDISVCFDFPAGSLPFVDLLLASSRFRG